MQIGKNWKENEEKKVGGEAAPKLPLPPEGGEHRKQNAVNAWKPAAP